MSHELSSSSVGIGRKAIARMKRRASTIIYNNLLLQPKRKQFNPTRVGPGFHDWDLVTCINELRRYIYGRVTESSVSAALAGQGRINVTRCVMAFYPLVDYSGATVLQELDGWLVGAVSRAYRKRCELLGALGHSAHKLTTQELIDGSWYSFPKIPVETRMPSFYKSWRYVRRAAEVYGLERFPSPAYDYI